MRLPPLGAQKNGLDCRKTFEKGPEGPQPLRLLFVSDGFAG